MTFPPSRTAACFYRAGVRLRQAQVLHDRAEPHPYATSEVVQKFRQLLTSLGAALDELTAAHGLGPGLSAAAGERLRRARAAWDGWSAQDAEQRPTASPAREPLADLRRLLEEVVSASGVNDAWLALGLEIPDLH